MKILGVVENMSGFVCPTCKFESVILPATSGGAEKMCRDQAIPLLGKVPLDPAIGQVCSLLARNLKVSFVRRTNPHQGLRQEISSELRVWNFVSYR